MFHAFPGSRLVQPLLYIAPPPRVQLLATANTHSSHVFMLSNHSSAHASPRPHPPVTQKVGDLGVDPSAGVTLAHTHGGCGGGASGGNADKKGLAVVGLSADGSSLVVFPAASDPPSAARAALPADVLGVTGAVSSVADLAGTGGGVLELQQGGIGAGGSVAVSLSSGKGGGGACAVSGLDGAKEARPCGATEGGCALAGGVSLSGKTFVASASVLRGGE